MIEHHDTIDRLNADIRRRVEEIHATIDRPHVVLDAAAWRLQPDGLILGRRHQPLACEAIPARITLDGSLPSCRPQAGPLWRAPIPAAPVAPTRETNTMTATSALKHEQTPEQTERLWALGNAREVLANKASTGMFSNPGETFKASNYKLIELAEWLIGDKPEPEAAEEEPAAQRVHSLVHELSSEEARDVARHAMQHGAEALVLWGDLGLLADMDDDEVQEAIAEGRRRLDELPEEIAGYKSRNPFSTDFGALLEGLFQGSGLVVTAQDGSLTVDEAPDAAAAVAEPAAAEPAAEEAAADVDVAEGGDNRTAETDAVVAEHDEQDRS